MYTALGKLDWKCPKFYGNQKRNEFHVLRSYHKPGNRLCARALKLLNNNHPMLFKISAESVYLNNILTGVNCSNFEQSDNNCQVPIENTLHKNWGGELNLSIFVFVFFLFSFHSACSSNCAICTSLSSCSHCSSGFLYQDACITTCPTGYYGSSKLCSGL